MNGSRPTYRKSAKGLLLALAVCFVVAASVSCRSSASNTHEAGTTYTNPIYTHNSNTSITYHDGIYYLPQNAQSRIYLAVSKDPATLDDMERHMICDVQKNYGLTHMWHPQLLNIDGVWYLYITADDGNTDNHQMYVLENPAKNPLEGEFVMKGCISTDPDDNWAIHGNVFRHNDQLYMLWSGWETRRVFVETQCIYIARLENPWTLASDRVKISQPEYEWERQWVRNDGTSITSYPVYVNEAPFYFCNDKTDKVYVYYSASANWTPYHCFGQLTAAKNGDLLDPASWSKNEKPVFKQSREFQVYGPSMPYIIPSPDSEEYFLVYSAAETDNVRTDIRQVYMQKIEISPEGVPDLGKPAARTAHLAKPSGLCATK